MALVNSLGKSQTRIDTALSKEIFLRIGVVKVLQRRNPFSSLASVPEQKSARSKLFEG